ncbi:MAG: DEAD/DEAH box helicase family protein [Simkaniaceae bacterium]
MNKKNFVNFAGAKKFAQSLGLKGKSAWETWIKSNVLPANIPRHPSGVYKNKGWNGWGDFLGTGNKAPRDFNYRSYIEARQFVHSLNLKNTTEWKRWANSGKRSADIPKNPAQAYRNSGWINFADFLGVKIIPNKRTFPSFEKARDFARSLKLESKKDWLEWFEIHQPLEWAKWPNHLFKDKGWKGWNDFLGITTPIIDRRRKYRLSVTQEYCSFTEARAYAHSLNLKSMTDWKKLVQKNALPSKIPSYPDQVYKNKGWKGAGDFLGTGAIASQNREFLRFEEAKKVIQELELKSMSEWRKWAKSIARPANIPACPWEVYKNDGWNGIGDFLGTGTIAPQNKKFRSFKDARNFAKTLNLSGKEEWVQWTKTDARPIDIPAYPNEVYAKLGWNGWGNFLGTGFIAHKNRTYRSFHEARLFVRALGLQNKEDWAQWAKSKERPEDIPKSSNHIYEAEWQGWGDWLGTDRIANQNKEFLSFEEARDFARSLKFQSQGQWRTWAKTANKPENIPANPAGVYEDKWIGWGDWIGIVNSWNESNIRAFVSSLLPHLNTFSAAGLYVLFQQTGILEITPGSRSQSFVQALKTGRFPKEELEKFVTGERSLVNEFFDDSEMSIEGQEEKSPDDPLISEDKLPIKETLIQGDLPSIDTQGILATLDSKLFSTLDKEAIDFFIKEAVARIWQQAFLDEAKAVEQLELYGDEGVYSQEVKRLFLHDYHGAKSLQIPSGYCFPHQPLLMQFYTAYLIKTRKKLGNWSGTGAGKTLSAILASRVIHAGLTVICCPNNVIGNWKRNILEIYPESSVFIKETDVKKDMSKKTKYLILNYEFFQQPKTEQKLKALVDNNIIDFIIIDEIHYSKQREAEKISLRKATISAFLSEASAQNENLHVLGMSATPVINNLFEGKTLIEMVTGVHHDELNTKPTIPNCIAHYQKFVSHGIRWVPQYDYRLNLHTERIDCSEYLSEIKHQSAYGSMVDLEAVLTRAKLPFILDFLKPKTIVYTHYLKDILPVLQEAIEKKGWHVAVFTGENKDGLDAFIDGNADVLIASSCVGTGVDRLQHVCNRLIISSLPWTHAEFEQLKGRIYRQGQIKDHVDVLVPLTYADVNGEEWSWCNSRWKRIQFKKSVSDAAVDGVIPEGHLRTPAQAYKDTMLWLDRLDRGEIYEIERRKISIPLIGEVKPNVQRKMGDLSQMNSRINHAPSSETHKQFLAHPEEWECYHSTYRENRKSWPVVPYEEAVKWFKARPHMVIGDFGCGEALLAANIENKVFSFDHVAINENVTACDMCHTSLDDACLDAAVFSLSLMGSNFIDYLKEAHRCLKLDGHLWIAEPTSRIQNIELFRDLLFRLGFDVSRVDEKWKFIFIKAIKSEREVNIDALGAINYSSVLS